MTVRIITRHVLDVLRGMPAESVHCVVTSPPYYGLRDYKIPPQVWGGEPGCEHEWGDAEFIVHSGGTGKSALQQVASRTIETTTGAFCLRCGAWRGSLGLEPTLELYLDHVVEVCREIRRVLRRDGTFWMNIGDSYSAVPTARGVPYTRHTDQKSGLWAGTAKAKRDLGNDGSFKDTTGLKPKDLLLVPARLAIRLQEDGWWVRSDIIWAKRAPMPESCTDRPTSAHEHVFLLTRGAKYFFDAEAVKEESSDNSHGSVNETRSEKAALRNIAGITKRSKFDGYVPSTRNLRNFWLLGPEPFSEWNETVRQVRVEPDAVVDGKKRKVSPDCPLHADRSGQVANAPDDGHGGGLFGRSERNDGDPGREQPDDFAPIDPILGSAIEARSWDLPAPSSGLAAIRRSSGNHRMARVPETNPPCIASAQTADGTERTSGQPEFSGSVGRTPASKILPGDLGAHPSAETPDRSVRMSSSVSLECICEYYIDKTEKTSHFATFPTEIPRRAILAGTSAKGCCPKCGAGWVRVVRKTFRATRTGVKAGAAGNALDPSSGWDQEPNGINDTETLGWRPSCSCDAAEPVPATVLDPFLGSGTTALVADRLGRDCIGIELSPEYGAMAERRLRDDAGMFTELAAE